MFQTKYIVDQYISEPLLHNFWHPPHHWVRADVLRGRRTPWECLQYLPRRPESLHHVLQSEVGGACVHYLQTLCRSVAGYKYFTTVMMFLNSALIPTSSIVFFNWDLLYRLVLTCSQFSTYKLDRISGQTRGWEDYSWPPCSSWSSSRCGWFLSRMSFTGCPGPSPPGWIRSISISEE